jgi:predicted acetyltransferase
MTDQRPSLDYRLARAADLDAAASLVAHSFPGPTRPPDWIRTQLETPVYGGGPETLVLGGTGGHVVAACQIHPLRTWVGGALLPTAGVGTVAISPAHRRRGLGADLVTAALRIARDRGDVASSLYPFRVGFYQSLGYGQAGEALQYRFPPRMLADSPERERVELIDGVAGRAEALALYNRWAASETGQLERGEAVWARSTEVHDRALVGYRAGDPSASTGRGDDGSSGGRSAGSAPLEGYALVVYRADLPAPERYLEVDEIVWTTERARQGLYAWLASLADQWQQVVVRALPSHRFGDWLREPRLPSGSAPMWNLWAPMATLMAGTMFRILDMPGAWQERRIADGTSLTAMLEVRDGQIGENAGTWRIALNGGRAELTRGDGAGTGSAGTGPADVRLRLDVSTLSRLYVGSLTATSALAAGLLECDRPERLPALDRALALPEPWTFDRF